MKNITIIGGGIVGAAIAYTLSKQYDKVELVEKLPGICRGNNQTTSNAGVMHAGIYYEKKKKPLKANLCVEGIELMYNFCEKFNVPHKKIGKLLVATDKYSEGMLLEQYEFAKENGVPNIKILSGKEVNELEPNIKCTLGMYSENTGIVNPVALTKRLIREATKIGLIFSVGHEVVDITDKGNYFMISTKELSRGKISSFESDIVINSAGLYADEIARMVNPKSKYKVTPTKIEFATFNRSSRSNLMVSRNVYPAAYYLEGYSGKIIQPTQKELDREYGKTIFKTIGTHLTPEIDNNGSISDEVIITPISTGRSGKEDYENRIGINAFYDRVKDFFPGLELNDLAKTKNPETEKGSRVGIITGLEGIDDFVIERDSLHPNLINLLGIESPGMTSCLGIAKYVNDLLKE